MIHIIDIGPHGFLHAKFSARVKQESTVRAYQWNIGCTIIRDDLSDCQIVLISISALMKAESPIRHHRSLSDDLAVLLGYIDWSWTGEKVHVYDTSERIIFKVLTVGVVDFNIHPIRVQQKDAVRFVGATMLKVDRVITWFPMRFTDSSFYALGTTRHVPYRLVPGGIS